LTGTLSPLGFPIVLYSITFHALSPQGQELQDWAEAMTCVDDGWSCGNELMMQLVSRLVWTEANVRQNQMTMAADDDRWK